jgi:hypothetical protein
MLDKLFHYHRFVASEVPSEFRRHLYADNIDVMAMGLLNIAKD